MFTTNARAQNLTMHIYKHALHAAAPPLAKATVAVGLLLASVRLSSRRRATASYVQKGRTPAAHVQEVQKQQMLSPLSAESVLAWPTSYAWVQHPGVLLAGLVCSTVGVVTLQAAAAAAATTATVPVTAVAAAAAAAVSACMMWPNPLSEEVVATQVLQPEAGQHSRCKQQQPQALVVDAATLAAACGTWVKDPRRSSGLSQAFDLLCVSAFVRRSAALVKGFRVEVKDGLMTTSPVLALPVARLTERYPLGGTPQRHKRRFMKPGKQQGRLVGAADGVVVLRVDWGEPCAGHALDQLQLLDGGKTLCIREQLQVGGRSVEVVDYYTRKHT